MAKTTVKHLDGKVNELQSYFEAEMGKFRSELRMIKTPDAATSGEDKLESLLLKFGFFEATVSAEIQSLKKEVTSLKQQCDRINLTLDNCIQEANISKLLLYGVPERADENPLNDVIDTIKLKLKIPLNGEDLISCYRYGRKKSSGTADRPLLLHFADVRKRNEIFQSKKLFKGTKLAITELLSPLRYDIYKTVKEKVGKGKCWTNNGRVGYCWNGRTYHISSIKHFLDICK